MQNSVISADFSVFPFMGASKKSTARGVPSADDTFMNILNERIAAGNNGRAVSARSTGLVKATDGIVRDEAVKGIQNPKCDNDARASGLKAEGTENAKVSREAESAVVKEDRPKVGIEEEIENLEAMIALLEDLLAILEALSVPAGPSSTAIEMEPFLSSGTVSPMELLMALAEGNIQKLKALVKELGDGMPNPEVNELAEKIRNLIEKLEGSEEKGFIQELVAELVADRKEPALEEVINGLKAKCGQLIQKLREQVSKLRDALLRESEEHTADPEAVGAAGEEPEKTGLYENETKAETKTGMKSNEKKAEAEEPDTHGQAINKDGGESFEKIIIPNNRVAVEHAKEIRQAAKTPAIITQRPLEQLVTNQVMMKVKLMAGENRQEMEMHLKPESLGKLSLKIIHERGEILARITTENEQVREILENNMQLLKDALEKNGFSVQSLSVSVGNEHNESRTKEEPGTGSRNMAGSSGRSEMKSSMIGMPDLRTKIEKEYYGQNSRIILTA